MEFFHNFWKCFDWSENSWKLINSFYFVLFWFSFWISFLTFPFEKKYEKIQIGHLISLFWEYYFVLFFSYVLIHFENSCAFCLFLHFPLHEKYFLKSKKSIKKYFDSLLSYVIRFWILFHLYISFESKLKMVELNRLFNHFIFIIWFYFPISIIPKKYKKWFLWPCMVFRWLSWFCFILVCLFEFYFILLVYLAIFRVLVA